MQPWIEWALASQTADGNFGPVTDRPAEPGLQRDKARDWWPRMVVLKVLQQYHSATGDPRVLDFMGRYFRYQLAQLSRTPLDNWTKWGRVRGGDNLAVVYWLYNLTGEKFLLELGELILMQTFDWTGVFLHGDHLSRPYSLHCVDLGQGFEEPVVYWQQSGDSRHIEAVGRAVEKMRHTIGLPTGLWAGDEKLCFGDPTLGSELCTAVEMMFSLEQILQITGGREWGDYLERVAYNALPTQTTDAQDARQYYQQVNQVEVTRKVRPFSTPHEDTDIVFGLYTGYPSCTSNLHQGWPKLVQNLWYATATAVWPLWSTPLRMNEKWERHAMEPEKQTLYGPYYYEVTSDSLWNYCLPKANVRPEKVAESFVVEDAGEMAPYPWTPDGSPVKIRTQAHRIGDWTLHGGSAGADRLRFLAADVHDVRSGVDRTDSLRLYDPACYGVSGAIDERRRIRNAARSVGRRFFGTGGHRPTVRPDSASVRQAHRFADPFRLLPAPLGGGAAHYGEEHPQGGFAVPAFGHGVLPEELFEHFVIDLAEQVALSDTLQE